MKSAADVSFWKELKSSRPMLTKQQYRTIKGQKRHGGKKRLAENSAKEAAPMKTTTDFQLVATDKLIPYVNNARTHSKEQITKLRSSLREFGFINPIIIDKDFNVIAGHGRLMAAKEEGIDEVP